MENPYRHSCGLFGALVDREPVRLMASSGEVSIWASSCRSINWISSIAFKLDQKACLCLIFGVHRDVVCLENFAGLVVLLILAHHRDEAFKTLNTLSVLGGVLDNFKY